MNVQVAVARYNNNDYRDDSKVLGVYSRQISAVDDALKFAESLTTMREFDWVTSIDMLHIYTINNGKRELLFDVEFEEFELK